MKNILLCSFLFLSGALSASGCSDQQVFFPCDKSYITEDQVQLTKEGISILFPTQIFQTSAVHADEGGLYFKDFKKKGACSDGKWECQVCFYCNPNYSLYCGICWN